MLHLRNLWDVDDTTIRRIVDRGLTIKAGILSGNPPPLLAGKVLGLLFEKPSLRTRTSFEVGMFRLGGQAIALKHYEVGLGKREPVADVARVFSSYVDAIVVRTFDHINVQQLAEHSSVPVINGLCDTYHPCQILADLLTLKEQWGDWRGRRLAWVGDGNNVCHSWMIAAAITGFQLRIATPESFQPDAAVFARCNELSPGSVVWSTQCDEIVTGTDAIITDVWVSMGQEKDAEEKRRLFMPYQVNQKLMEKAADHALLLHCLPAHRGDEVTAALIDGPRSVAWQEAENRLHAQSGLLVEQLSTV
ncbi:MAG: ornithine carbamoyltransferase [Myxococcota bacterium]|nr:ornithine carbamoyltransferase [Myxococcota bacterium]